MRILGVYNKRMVLAGLFLLSLAFAQSIHPAGVDPNLCEPGEVCPTNPECCGPICNYNTICESSIGETYPSCSDCVPKFPWGIAVAASGVVIIAAYYWKDDILIRRAT